MVASPVYATFVGDHRFDDRMDDLSEAAEDADAGGDHRHRGPGRGPRPGDRCPPAAGSPGASSWPRPTTPGPAPSTAWPSWPRTRTPAPTPTCSRSPRRPRPPTPTRPPGWSSATARATASSTRPPSASGPGWPAGARPPRICVERSLNQVDGYLASSLDDDPFVQLPPPQDPEGWDEAAWRSELREVTETVIRPAFARYRAVLADELQPVARPDDRPGLCHLDGGDETVRRPGPAAHRPPT